MEDMRSFTFLRIAAAAADFFWPFNTLFTATASEALSSLSAAGASVPSFLPSVKS
jgi:hypothetical protein